MTVMLVDVSYNQNNELCATLTDGVVAVRCDDVLFLDFVGYESMCFEFDMWRRAADAGEIGYYFV